MEEHQKKITINPSSISDKSIIAQEGAETKTPLLALTSDFEDANVFADSERLIQPETSIVIARIPYDADYQHQLHQEAIRLVLQGYPVIPTRGDRDPLQPKAPATTWTRYQKQLPTATTIQKWFLIDGHGGLAVVCGMRHAVLDFDNPQLAEQFAQQYPDLTNTYTVRSGTRRLPHYYFRTPEGLSVASRKVQGFDLQGIGRYVITAPTQFSGYRYEVIKPGQPRALTEADLQCIHAFMDSCQPSTMDDNTPVLEEHLGEKSTDQDLIREYHRLVHVAKKGRNEALFAVAKHARNGGWTEKEVVACLVDIHVHEPAPQGHRRETAAQRREEALDTIESAFSRRPYLSNHSTSVAQGIPTSVRERLSQQKLCDCARLLDALCFYEYEPGEVITKQIAKHIGLEYGIKPKAVERALKGRARTPDGKKAVFEIVDIVREAKGGFSDPELHPTIRSIVSPPLDTLQNTAHNSRGRPEKRYRIPSTEQLCALLGVKETWSDPIQPEDLASNSKYRSAIHRGLIERKPGQYGRGFLGNRLGVSGRTTAKYDVQQEIEATPKYDERRIGWDTLDKFPWADFDKNEDPGLSLTDSQGKHYRVRRAIAVQFLKRGEAVYFARRAANHYELRSSGEEVED